MSLTSRHEPATSRVSSHETLAQRGLRVRSTREQASAWGLAEVLALLGILTVLLAEFTAALTQAPARNLHLLLVVNRFVAAHPLVATADRLAAQQLIVVLAGIFAVASCLLAWQRRWARLLAVALTLTAAELLNLALATLRPEARPFSSYGTVHQLIAHGPGQSFPSDHATAAVALGVAAWLFISTELGVSLAVGAALVGLARVAGGVHYPADVLAGATCAVGSGLLAAMALQGRGLPGRGRKTGHPDS